MPAHAETWRLFASGGGEVDYRLLRVGDPVGKDRVIACAKCGKPGIAYGKTMLHVVGYAQLPSGEACIDKKVKCPGGVPHETPKPRTQTGFAWCPKEWL